MFSFTQAPCLPPPRVATRNCRLECRLSGVDSLLLDNHRIEYDRSATAEAYRRMPKGGAESCGCEPCQNWVLTRQRLMPSAFVSLLDRFGVSPDRDAEVYHNCRLDSGLHDYGGWYHFVGRMSGATSWIRNFEGAALEPFEIRLRDQHDIVSDAFAGCSIVQLDFHAIVPWLSDLPEPEV